MLKINPILSLFTQMSQHISCVSVLTPFTLFPFFRHWAIQEGIYASPQKLDNLLRYKNAGKNSQESPFNSL